MWEELAEYGTGGAEEGAASTEGATESFDAPGGDNVAAKDSDTKEAEEKVKKQQAKKKGSSVAQTIGNAPLPHISMPGGSIGLMLLATLLLVFAIVPVSSGSKETRLSLFWGAITGRVKVGGIGNSPSQTGDQSKQNTAKSNSTQAVATTGTGATTSYNPFYKGW